MAGLVEITDANFQEEIVKNGPAAIKFWAEWWGGCKTIAPVMEQLAEEYKGKVKIVGMNVDQAPDTASTLGVMSIPVVVFFKDGQEAGRVVGGSKDKIAAELDKIS